MDKKLTDSEIVKALECCKSDTALCNECPYDKIGECIEKMCADSINLINRLQAENERLKPFEDKIAKFNSHIRVEDMLVFASSLEEWLEFCENLKAEAYKEFAELVHCHCESIINHKWNKKVSPVSWADAYEQFDEEVDNLLKEMVGEDNAEEKE